MSKNTVQQSDFDQLSEHFLGLTDEYLKLANEHAKLQDTYSRILDASRETHFDRATVKEFKSNLLGDNYD